MSTELDIEAERTLFIAAYKVEYLGCSDREALAAFEAEPGTMWLAARRASPADAVPEGALAPAVEAALTKCEKVATESGAWESYRAVGEAFAELRSAIGQVREIARAAVEADRAQIAKLERQLKAARGAADEHFETILTLRAELDEAADRAQQGEPSLEEDAYMHACDEMERFQKLRAKRGVEIGTQGSLCDGIAWLFGRIEELELAATKAASPADAPTDLPKRLRIKAGVMASGEKIAWGSDTELMLEAADYIERAAPVPDTGTPTSGEVEKAGNRFFNFNVLPTLTKEQEAAAEKGYCPVCNALELYEVNVAHGMRFCKCNHCKDIVVLAGPSEAKAGESNQ